jgi:hypothetical protein
MHAEGPKADQPASTCEPTNSFSFSSITTSGATVSWEAVAGAASYYVHWQPVAGGTEQNTQVSGTSVVLTGLDACTAYRVRIRTRCGPTTFSEFTAWSPFETASTNPSVSIEVEYAQSGCAAALLATDGFDLYTWRNSRQTVCSGSDPVIHASSADTIWLTATDAFGCTADNYLIVGPFSSSCISESDELELVDSLNAKRGDYASIARMLAVGMAAMANNDTIKCLVKFIAQDHFNRTNSTLNVFFNELIDSCQAKGIDLVSRLQEIVWNGREAGSSPDTARIRSVLPSFRAENSLRTTIYPHITFNYLSEVFQNPDYPNWDTLNVEYVAAVGFHSAEQIPLYRVDSAGNVVSTLMPQDEYIYSIPVWQIGFAAREIPNPKHVDPVLHWPTGWTCACKSEFSFPDPPSGTMFPCTYPRPTRCNCGDMGCLARNWKVMD